jgi:signal transduction histidine kinase
MSSDQSSAPVSGPERQQRLQLLGQVAGTVAHDFNNVLAAISGSAGLIELDPAGPHSPRHLENIRRAVQRAATMLRQFQCLNPRNDGPFEPLDVARLVREAAASLQPTLGPGCQLTCASAPDLPALRADAGQVSQVLLHLGENARDAMPHGGHLELVAARRILSPAQAAQLGGEAQPGDFIVLGVHDTGTGIAPAAQARLFEPFFTTKPKGKAAGLGLATVWRMVNRHAGFVRIESEVGHGTRADCYFPVAGPPTAG